MSFEITKEMKTRTAKNIFEEIIQIKRFILSANINSILSAEEIIEKMGYTIQCCIHEIMRELDVIDDNSGNNYGIISDCIMDDDSFDYLVEKLHAFGLE